METNENEIKRQLQQLRQMQIYLTEGGANQRNLPRIMEIFQSPIHRNLKLQCYTLLKTIDPEELVTIQPVIEADIKSPDPEISFCGLKLLQCLPLIVIIESLKTLDLTIAKILDGKVGVADALTSEFHYEKLTTLHSLFVQLTTQETSVDPSESPSPFVCKFYLRIAENTLSINRDISANSILCLANLFQQLQGESLRNPENLCTVDFSRVINPVVQFLLPRIKSVLERISSFETRIKSRMLPFISFLLAKLIQKDREINKSKLVPLRTQLEIFDKPGQLIDLHQLVDDFLQRIVLKCVIKPLFEIDVIVQGYTSIFTLMNVESPRSEFLIGPLFEHLDYYIRNIGYRKELNYITINLLSLSQKASPYLKLAVAMRSLEIATTLVQTQITRFLIMLISFHNMIEASMHMLTQGRQSFILGLFSQQWFLNKIKQDEAAIVDDYEEQDIDICLKEEILISFIVASIHYGQKNQKSKYFHSVILDVLDVTYRMINWKTSQKSKVITLSIDLFLILLEEAIDILSMEELKQRIQELLSRLNSFEINLIPKVKTLLLLSRKFTEQSLSEIGKIDYNQAIGEFRTFMIQQPTSPQHPLRTENYGIFINHLQVVYQTIYYLYMNFNSQGNYLKQNILEILSVIYLFQFRDFNGNLSKLIKQKAIDVNIVQNLIDFNKRIVQIIQDNEQVEREYLTINIELRDTSLQVQNHEPKEIIQTAYNIFLKSFIENKMIINHQFFEQKVPIHNLRSLLSHLTDPKEQPNIFFNLECNSQLINGVSDFIQLYCSHVIDLSSSSVCLGLRLVNLCPFKLDNIVIKILLDPNCILEGKNSRIIEEFPSYQQKQVFYKVKTEALNSLQFTFDVILQDIRTEYGQYTIRGHNYRISLIEFLIPNYFHFISRSAFDTMWTNLTSSFHVSCLLDQGYQNLLSILQYKPFGVVVLDNKLYMLSCVKNIDSLISEIFRLNEQKDGNQELISLGLLSYMLDGSVLALKISNIGTKSDHNIVAVEIKSSSKSIQRTDLEQLIQDLSDGFLKVMT